jgi:hypothetical protein
MTDPLTRAAAYFNVQEYREALLAFEERWHMERSDVLRALIQLSNAMNQLRLGLVTSPRHLLASAERLLAPHTEPYEGIDLVALRAAIGSVRAVIPDGLETGEGSVPWEAVPRMVIERRVL